MTFDGFCKQRLDLCGAAKELRQAIADQGIPMLTGSQILALSGTADEALLNALRSAGLIREIPGFRHTSAGCEYWQEPRPQLDASCAGCGERWEFFDEERRYAWVGDLPPKNPDRMGTVEIHARDIYLGNESVKVTNQSDANSSGGHQPWERMVAFACAVAFIVLLVIVALFVPNPTSFQYIVFKTLIALAAAGFVSMVPGFLSIQISTWLRAGGAMAVFVLVYLYNPASMLSQGSGPKELPHVQSPEPEQVLLEPDAEKSLIGVRLGDAWKRINKMYGPATSIDTPPSDSKSVHYLYKRSDGAYSFVVNREGKVTQVGVLSLGNPRIATVKKIHFGSTPDSVIDQYGQPIRARSSKDRLVLRYPNYSLAFVFSSLEEGANSFVVGIILTAPMITVEDDK